jgi:hypothetical protein
MVHWKGLSPHESARLSARQGTKAQIRATSHERGYPRPMAYFAPALGASASQDVLRWCTDLTCRFSCRRSSSLGGCGGPFRQNEIPPKETRTRLVDPSFFPKVTDVLVNIPLDPFLLVLTAFDLVFCSASKLPGPSRFSRTRDRQSPTQLPPFHCAR